MQGAKDATAEADAAQALMADNYDALAAARMPLLLSRGWGTAQARLVSGEHGPTTRGTLFPKVG